MGTIARTAKAGGGTNFNSGQTIDPAEVNTDLNTLFTEVNGALDDGNLETATVPGAKSLRFTEISAPSSPSSNDLLLYAKDSSGTSRLYTKDSAGTETEIGARGRTGEVLNLVVKQTAGSEAASVTITADAIDIEGYRATAVSVAASLAASGAAGLDTGTEAANTTYYVWLIRKSTDGTMNGLLSLSATAPTMPATYDQKRLIAHRRNDNSSNMIRQVQCNDLVLCTATSLGTAITSDTDLDLSTFCPAAIADCVLLSAQQTSATIEWEFLDKDDTTVHYGQLGQGNANGITAWARKNASNIVTLKEAGGASTVGVVFLLGWKVKVL